MFYKRIFDLYDIHKRALIELILVLTNKFEHRTKVFR